jgi:transcriptional regulator of nitric oxide reductase/ferredoxin
MPVRGVFTSLLRGLVDSLRAAALVFLVPAIAASSPFAMSQSSPTPDAEALAKSFFPIATRIGPMEGEPPSAAVFQRGRVIGYLLFTQDVVASKGFSGKPFNIALGLDLEGHLAGLKIVEQHEPILVIGVSPGDLDAFVRQYVGLDVRTPVKVVRTIRESGQIDAVSGATISSVVLSDAIIRSARAVGRERGILESAAIDFDRFEKRNWSSLFSDGSIISDKLTYDVVRNELANKGGALFPSGASEPAPQALVSEIYIALATPARIGRNLVGDLEFNAVMADLAEGDQIIFVAGSGIYSFKGTAYRRSGYFDRFQIVQDDKTFIIRRADYKRIDELAIEGFPKLRDKAFFVLPASSGFDPAREWRLDLVIQGENAEGAEVSALFPVAYDLPEYYHLPSTDSHETFLGYDIDGVIWIEIWRDRIFDIAIVLVALTALAAVLVLQDKVAMSRHLHNRLRLGFLIFTTVWLGWYAGAQLSVLNVLTFAEALRTGFEWQLFLLEPLVFILWGFVALTLLFWGRGVYCGWLCPFGAMQELLAKVARALKIPQLKIPFVVNERLWPIKYILFLLLFAVALGDMMLAQTLSEIEPFKTAVVLHFIRDWRFVLYAAVILGMGLFVERAWCRYLCPLGAALAIPARLRMFEWLRRRWICGTQCGVCAISCPVQAIHPDGHINPNECVHCLNCQVQYFDDQVCPTMVQRRKRREKLAASPAPDLSRLPNTDGGATS